MKFKFTVDYPNRIIRAEGKTINGLTYTGKAECLPTDTFDVKTGKKVARLKAEIRQLAHIRKVANENMQATLELLDLQSRRIEKIKAAEMKKIHELKSI